MCKKDDEVMPSHEEKEVLRSELSGPLRTDGKGWGQRASCKRKIAGQARHQKRRKPGLDDKMK
jgi:hypothetical protein